MSVIPTDLPPAGGHLATTVITLHPILRKHDGVTKNGVTNNDDCSNNSVSAALGSGKYC